MAYELNAEGSNGVNATTSISNLESFDFGVLLQLDCSQSDGMTALAVSSTDAAIVASGAAGGIVGILGEPVPPNFTQPLASTLPSFQGNNAAVLGLTDSTAVALFVPPYASNAATDFKAGVKGVSTDAVGVGGVSDSGTGVYATSNSGAGVSATSTSGYGVDAYSTENTAIHAISTKGMGLYVQSGTSPFAPGRVAGGLAGLFVGPVQVAGSLTVFGNKSAAVKVSGGSYRQLFCLEAPESWFEDLGEAQLVSGKAEVKFDPQFASVVRTNHYHVFVSPYGDCNGLYVSGRSPRGFTVREFKKGTSNVRFSYRIAARRKDVPDERMPEVALPEIATVQRRDPPSAKVKKASKAGKVAKK